jgi:ribosomal protein L19E
MERQLTAAQHSSDEVRRGAGERRGYENGRLLREKRWKQRLPRDP